MRNLRQQIATLPAEKRKLLELFLQEQGRDLAQAMILPQSRPADAHRNGLPLSFAQQRLWLLDQLAGATTEALTSAEAVAVGAAYNLFGAFRLQGPLHVQALHQAVNALVQRHEILRTRFTTVDGEPRQIIEPHLTLALPVVDVPAATAADLHQSAGAAARRPFDLSQLPLLRLHLLRVATADHVLLLTMHHIIADGWSIGVFVQELLALYKAAVAGQSAALPDLPIQYADYALWQRQWLSGKILAEQVAYWQGQLQGSAAQLPLPTDRPRPAVQSFNGAEAEITLPSAVANGLRELSRQHDATLFMTLLAAWQTLLYRYTNQGDISVGTAIANRNRTETEGLIGFFVNTLVLRSQVDGNLSFRDFLLRVREMTLNAYAHQDLPFATLVEKLQPTRNRSHSPFFQVMFDLSSDARQTLDLPGLQISTLPVDVGTAQFDLVLYMTEITDGLRARLVYNTDLFNASTIEWMLAHFGVLLAAIVEGHLQGANRRLADLPLLTAVEKAQLLGNKSAATLPVDQCLHTLFEAQVARTPHAVAVVYEDQQMTYQELNQQANRLAYLLQRQGVGAGTLVALYLERSLQMVVSILGVLKAGGAYVPLDTAYPPDRLAFMLQDTGAPVVVTQESLMTKLPVTAAQVICLEQVCDELVQGGDPQISPVITPAHPAYVIYTSGSTGKPKGVMVSHANVVRLFQATQEWYRFDEHDVWTLFHSYAFDFSVWEIWGALLYGGRLVVVPYLVSRSPDAFYELVGREQVTVLNQTPSAFRQLIHAEGEWGKATRSEEEKQTAALTPSPGHLVTRSPLALRLIIFGGEALELQSLRPWFARHGDQQPQLVNMYGITETTVHVTYRPITLADLDATAAMPASWIGGPIPDLQLYVLDQAQQLAPIGLAGELYVGGAGLAHGYLNRPELTAERFVPNPFSHEPGARLYKSGDLARRLPDGDLDYLGRIDHQVKIRGFRIELGEIEAALGQFPGIRETVVLLHAEPQRGERAEARLVAYFVANLQHLPTAPELRHFLQQKLPAYMIPATFVPLERFPLTPNGKLDRNQLLAMPLAGLAQSAQIQADDDMAGATPTAELLAQIWADVLGVDVVSHQANFFDVGGHSLLAVKLAARLRETFQVTLPMAAVFETPTVATLAAQIEQAQRAAQGTALPPLQPHTQGNHDGSQEAPLSFVQQRLWFLHQLEPENPFYQMSGAVRLVGQLDVAALTGSLTEIVRRHEVLRTTFVECDGQASQRIHPPAPVIVQVADLTHLSTTEQEDVVRQRAREEAWQPFDLTCDPMLRVRLWRLADEEHIALFAIHHIVTDGWSMTVLIREVAALYTAFCQGQPSPLPALPVQYADFAAWQRTWLQGELLAQQVAYWQRKLAGAPPSLALPTDYPRVSTAQERRSYAVAMQSIRLPQALVDEVRALSRQEQVTLFMVLLAAFQTLLQRYSGQDDILVGTPIAGRNHPLLEGLIGFFVNTLVLRTEFTADPTFRQVLRQVRQTCLEAYAHQDVPFEKLVEALQVGGGANRHALFQVWFQLVERVVGEMQLPGVTLQPFDLDTTVPEFDLWLSLTEHAEGIEATMRYSNDLFHDQTIATMLDRFKTLLAAMVAEPDQPVSAYALVSATENAQLLHSFTADLEVEL